MPEWSVRAIKHVRGDLKKTRSSQWKKQLINIILTLENNPFEHSQSFEKLEPPADQKYSRRINRQHRVVYTVDVATKTVIIQAAWSHYE